MHPWGAGLLRWEIQWFCVSSFVRLRGWKSIAARVSKTTKFPIRYMYIKSTSQIDILRLTFSLNRSLLFWSRQNAHQGQIPRRVHRLPAPRTGKGIPHRTVYNHSPQIGAGHQLTAVRAPGENLVPKPESKTAEAAEENRSTDGRNARCCHVPTIAHACSRQRRQSWYQTKTWTWSHVVAFAVWQSPQPAQYSSSPFARSHYASNGFDCIDGRYKRHGYAQFTRFAFDSSDVGTVIVHGDFGAGPTESQRGVINNKNGWAMSTTGVFFTAIEYFFSSNNIFVLDFIRCNINMN